MARGGSDPFVERVREATDIVEVIGAQVQLKRMGARLGGLCPFHREKTPSFYVNPSMQAFHCFGCGTGGDVFSFLMQHEKMTFPEALKYLAEKAGIPLPDRRGPATDLLQRIREALAVARTWYRDQLSAPAGAEARTYLERREISPAMRETYGLGFVGDQWDGLLRHARALISERTLVEAGLAVESTGGRIYDRFRHRLMIPIETAGGAPIGFGGRALGDQEPKYLNSPETPVYHKGNVLFGIPAARDGIRAEGRVVVVEGYFDVIALVQAGIPGVVGMCGTAMTAEQAGLLRRLSDRVMLLFDGDAAGQAATLRALSVLAGEVAEVRVARPPAGRDPDVWVRAEGPDGVRRGLDGARGPLAYLEDLTGSGALSAREGAGKAADLITQLADPLTRDLWIQEASARFGIRTEAFVQAVQQRRGQPGREAPPAPAAPARDPLPSLGPFDRQCLRSALAHPSRAREMAEALEASATRETALAQVLRWIAERMEESGEPEVPGVSPESEEASAAAILSRAVRELPGAGELTALSLAEGGPPEVPEAILLKIEQRGLSRRMDALQREIRRAQEAGNLEEIKRFQTEQYHLAQERRRLTTRLAAGPGRSPAESEEKRTGQVREDFA